MRASSSSSSSSRARVDARARRSRHRARVSRPVVARARASRMRIAPRANSSDARANASVRGTRGAMPRARATRDEDARDGDGLIAKPLSASQALRRAAFPVAVAALGAFSFGYHCGVVNPALEALASDIGIARDVAAKGAVVSSMLMGAAFGSFAAGASADKFGRKKSLALAGVALALGSAACAAATTLRTMLAGRAIVGVGVGLVSILVPMYVSELSPPEHRGVLGSGPQLSIGFGILVAMFLGLPLQGVDVDPAWWRTMFWLATVPAVALATLANGIPESPSWLRSKGHFQEADAVESKQFGAVAPKRADDMGSTKVATWQETLQGRSNRRAVITGPMLFFIQQFAGINAIIYFSTAIFQSAGIESGVLASVAVCVVNIVGSVIATGLLDKTGRKPLLMYSFLGMAVSCVGLAIAGAFPAMVMAPALSLFSVLSYVFIFGMGAGPVPGLLSSEIFAPAVRGKGMSLCFLAHWIFNFCIGQGFLPAVEYFGASVVYMFFAAFSMFGFFFTQAYVVETKGKSLEQIAVELHT
jgi:sugar porter (SP) family MFS transporter